MRIKCGLAAAIVLSLNAVAAEGATVQRFSSFWAFGDSLSDPGNLNDLVIGVTGRPIERPDVVNGRLTNGPVWAEHVADDFQRRNLPTGNFAYIGANAAPDGPPNTSFPDLAPLIPSIPQQVALFTQRSPDLGGRPIASLLGGANDLLFGGIGSGKVASVARKAANGVADGALALRAAGIRDVILWSLPDLGKTPAYNLFQPDLRDEATRGTEVFNKTLRKRIKDLREAGFNVEQVDLYRFFNQLVKNPQRFGVSDATMPCVIPGPGGSTEGSTMCSRELVFLRAFYSSVHPNSVIHAGIADLVRDKVAPIPLPLPAFLLLGALAALVAAGGRRRFRRGS